ncbi:MAG: H-type lectin domain-containing protein [Prevotellaceae bacterium]|nr:H-type lectin domain-containing protein [Prevotellaceae bacterium]
MKRVFLFLPALLFAAGVMADNSTTTVEQVTSEVDLTTDVDYVITSTEPFATAGSVNIENTEHAVVIISHVKPSKVISTYLDHIYINGEQAVVDENCQVRLYASGAIVYPYGTDLKPLTCYSEENYGGDSCDDYGTGNTGGYMNTLTTDMLNNNIRSFKLKRGYMVTFATGISGWGYSRCFIADKADLEVSSVPSPLNGRASSYRVFKWYNAQKKGLANDTGADICDALNVTSCYSFGLGESRLPDQECVPHHIYEDWPSSSACGGVTYSPHLKTNNEPGNTSDPSPQSVDVVLDNWQNLMRTGMRLCSESSHDGSWYHIKDFIDSIDARGWRCDILDLHCYWTSGFDNMNWYSSYYGNGRPIWISEWVWGASWNTNGIFGSVSNTGSFSTANQQVCYNGTVPILTTLNNSSIVERYYYWNSEAVASKLYYNGQLSLLGQYYADMETDLAYNAANEYVPLIVYRTPSELTGTYTKKENKYELSWSDPNGDMMDSLQIQCKLPGSSRYATIATYMPEDSNSKSGVTYTYTDSIPEPGLYYYQVVEYYNGGKKMTTNEVNVTVSAAFSVGALQYGQLKLATSDEVTTDIEAQTTAPYVVTGMVSNKNSTNGITNQIVSLSKASFKFRLYPWQLETPVEISTAETVDYMILPPDTIWHLSDDMTLISQKIGTVKGEETQVVFPEAFPEGVTPVVVAQQNTSVSSYVPVTPKVSNVTNEGFTIKLVAQEGLTVRAENVNYFACSPGQTAIGEGKLLTAGRDTDTPCGGTSRQTVYFKDGQGDTLHLVNPYIIAAPQTDNYAAASVFRQHTTTSDDNGAIICASIRRQADGTSTVEEKNNASTNGDYIGWLIISDDTDGTDDLEPLITVETAIGEVSAETFSLYSADGCLWTDNASLRAYNTSGVRVPFGTRLPAGVYIVTDGRQTRKMVIRK